MTAKKPEASSEGSRTVTTVAAKPGKSAASPAEKTRLAAFYAEVVRAG